MLAAEPGQNFTRTVNTYGTGVSFAQAGFTFSGDYRRDDGNQPIFRTDFTGRDRFKLRGGWKWKNLVQIGATWQETKAHGDAPEIGYSTKVRELLADLEVGPVAKILTFHASAGEFKTTRDILIRQPQDFDIVPSAQREMGHTWEGGLRALWNRLTVDAAYLWMQNNGSIPFTINRVRARAEYCVRGEHRGGRRVDPRPVRREAGLRPGRVTRRLQRESIRHLSALAAVKRKNAYKISTQGGTR